MHLPPNDFDDCVALTPNAFTFLKKLAEKTPELSDVCDSLAYLDTLTRYAENRDAQILRSELLDLSEALQKRVLEPNENDNILWLEETITQDIDRLFNSLPKALLKKHNQTLQQVITPVETETVAPLSLPNNPIVEALKTSISTDTSAIVKPESLSPTLLDKLKSKAKLTPKQVVQVLAACAMLSLPSDKVQRPAGPEIMARMPDPLAQSIQTVQTKVNLQLPLIKSPAETVHAPQAPTAPEIPTEDPAVELLKQAAHPDKIINREVPHMSQRLQFVINTAERRALFETLRNDPRYRQDIALLCIIESNADVTAISHSGAMGPLQDMGGLQGAFGDPDTVDSLVRSDLLPTINNARYNQIIKLLKRGVNIQRGTLLEFLIVERKSNTDFWKDFLAQQKELLTDSESAAQIADLYLDDLVLKAQASLPINGDSLEALNFAVMSYNLGMGHLHTLRRLMNQNKVSTFNTYTVLSFIERSDFQEILRKNNLGNLHNNYEEAQAYLSRYIALQKIMHNQPPTT